MTDPACPCHGTPDCDCQWKRVSDDSDTLECRQHGRRVVIASGRFGNPDRDPPYWPDDHVCGEEADPEYCQCGKMLECPRCDA